LLEQFTQYIILPYASMQIKFDQGNESCKSISS